jgi:hypothetical protein
VTNGTCVAFFLLPAVGVFVLIWSSPWYKRKKSLDVHAGQAESSPRFLPFAPILTVGAVIGLASACAISTAGNAASEVTQISKDAASFVALLPNSDNGPCETCEEYLPPAPVAPQKPAKSQSKSEATGAPSSVGGSVEGAEPAIVAAPQRAHYPLNAPPCEGIAAYIITVFDKSEHSVASLSSDPKRQASRTLRRVPHARGTPPPTRPVGHLA